jgi:hypothetical protein
MSDKQIKLIGSGIGIFLCICLFFVVCFFSQPKSGDQFPIKYRVGIFILLIISNIFRWVKEIQKDLRGEKEDKI